MMNTDVLFGLFISVFVLGSLAWVIQDSNDRLDKIKIYRSDYCGGVYYEKYTKDAVFNYTKSNDVVYVCANGSEIPKTMTILVEVKQ